MNNGLVIWLILIDNEKFCMEKLKKKKKKKQKKKIANLMKGFKSKYIYISIYYKEQRFID